MAEHTYISFSMVEEMITCSICIEVIDDPRQLQCLHTYCYECLVQYLSSKDKKDQIKCPECRKVCPLPNGKVEDLPVSFLHNKLKDVKPSSCSEVDDDIGCNRVRHTCSAPSCSGKPASAFCDVCRYICSDCEDDHTQVAVLQGHVILSMEEAVENEENELPLCAQHPRELIKIYCEDCQLPVCQLCHTIDHTKHKCIEILNKSIKAKDQLRKIMKTLNMYLEKSKQFKNTVQEQADRINTLHASLSSIKLCSVQLVLYGKPCDFLLTVPSIQKQLDDHNPDHIRKRKVDNIKVRLQQCL